jgi:hypothetical protein
MMLGLTVERGNFNRKISVCRSLKRSDNRHRELVNCTGQEKASHLICNSSRQSFSELRPDVPTVTLRLDLDFGAQARRNNSITSHVIVGRVGYCIDLAKFCKSVRASKYLWSKNRHSSVSSAPPLGAPPLNLRTSVIPDRSSATEIRWRAYR